MAESKGNQPIPAFSRIRGLYRDYFYSFLEQEEALLCSPERLETILAREQRRFFVPLVESITSSKRLYDGPVGDNLLNALNRIRTGEIAQRQPGLLGCHYRAVGLPKLRESRYHLTRRYKALARERCTPQSSSHTRNDWQGHPERMFHLYDLLFGAQSTINQQVFHSHRPPGPIGLLFADSADRVAPDNIDLIPSVLDLRTAFTAVWDGAGKERSLCRALSNEVNQSLDLLLEFMLRGPRYPEQELESAIEQLKFHLQANRKSILTTLENNISSEDWQRTVVCFFKNHLPLNSRMERTDYILTFIQCYYLYEPFAGACVYTFPATVQPDLPTCGWTLTTANPLESDTLELLQRISEMVYGELFGHEVSRRYRHSFSTSVSLLRSRRDNPLPMLFDPGAEFILGAALAETPIPLEGAINFLSFVAETVKNTIYEGKRYGFLMVLVHQEFLERVVDRVAGDGPPSRPQSFKECFGTDTISIGVAAAGMRIHANERSSRKYALFFVYPPFGKNIVNLEQAFGGLKGNGHDVGEILNDRERMQDIIADGQVRGKGGVSSSELNLLKDVYERRAIVLDSVVKLSVLAKSDQLKREYSRISYVDLEAKPEAVAQALTLGSREVLAVSLDEDQGRLKLFHDGSVILASRNIRWELPEHTGDFSEELAARCKQLFRGRSVSEKLPYALSRRIGVFLDQQSRAGHGCFLVFHPEKKPTSWQDLDTVSREVRRKASSLQLSSLLEAGRELEGILSEFAEIDGAIVSTLVGEEDLALKIEPRILVKISGLLGNDRRLYRTETIEQGSAAQYVERRLRQVTAMKGLQAQYDYPKLRAVGTKHTAAYEYALLSKNGFAIVVSDDGPVSLFYCEKLRPEELRSRYQNAEILVSGDLQGWENRVQMLTR